ncbi:MAG: hypothetical protein E7677_02560 [Ruminococcaceae bacterium]|nr:hypothetical protein [Oscillospiraceae bacterium]
MIQITRGPQSWAETVYVFDGQYVRDRYISGDVLYTVDGNYIRKGFGTYGEIVYTISGNCIYDGSVIKYSIHGNNVVEGGQAWGCIAYCLQ